MKSPIPRNHVVTDMDDRAHDEVRRLREENERLRTENEQIYKEMLRYQHAISTLNPHDAIRQVHGRLARLQLAVHALNQMEPRTMRMRSARDLTGMIHTLLETALAATDTENGSVILLDDDRDELVFVDVLGRNRGRLLGYRMPADAGIVGACLASRSARFIEDVALEPGWSPEVQNLLRFETLSLICAPIFEGDRPIGAIEVISGREDGPLSEDTLDVLRLVAQMGTLALASFPRGRGRGPATAAP